MEKVEHKLVIFLRKYLISATVPVSPVIKCAFLGTCKQTFSGLKSLKSDVIGVLFL